MGEILLILHTGPIEKEPFKANLISDTCACFPIVCERLTVCSRALEMDLPYGLLHGELKCSALNSLHTRNKSCLCTAAGKDCSLQMVFSHLYDTQGAYGSMNDFELHLNGRSCLWCITLEASVTLICVQECVKKHHAWVRTHSQGFCRQRHPHSHACKVYLPI